MTRTADQEPAEPGSQTEETLAAIVRSATDTVPGAESAGVLLAHADGRITSHYPTSDVVASLDRLQATHGEGPCVTALREQHTLLVDDLGAEAARWPRFAPEAVEYGMASMLCFQVLLRDDSLGSLNFYASAASVFTAESLALGRLFATQAALALGDVPDDTHPHRVLEPRDVIAQAAGILMQRFGIDGERAFSILVSTAAETGMTLPAVARWLVEHITDPIPAR